MFFCYQFLFFRYCQIKYLINKPINYFANISRPRRVSIQSWHQSTQLIDWVDLLVA